MKIVFRYTIVALVLLSSSIFPQVDNIPLNHPVYTFLKEMKVKKVIPYISEDIPNLSRFQVKDYLIQVEEKMGELSSNEKKIIKSLQIRIL